MRRVLFAVAALLWTVPAQAQRIEIVNYGIYSADETSNDTMDNGVGHASVTNLRLASSTTIIPARQGVEFGLQFRVVGAPVGTVLQLRKVVRYPAPGAMPPSARQPILSYDRTFACAVGTICFAGYELDEAWEMLPGTWEFEFWNGNQKLAEQSFTLVAQ